MQPPTSTDSATLAPDVDTTVATPLLDALGVAIDRDGALPGLSGASYARDHAVFEEHSDQRQLIIDRLTRELAPRSGPLSVLSIGCGDGSVDAAVARMWIDGDARRRLRYVGIEPFAGSAAKFRAAMDADGFDAVDADVHVSTFDGADLDERFDVITFVHSLYYVPDVAAALRRAHAMLRPGGTLIAMSAPRGALNRLVGVLAPPVDGHPQWFSDDVAAAFEEAGLSDAADGRIDARLDLTDASDDVLDFTVQAHLTDVTRPLVLAYLDAVALPGPALVVPHPVDVYRATRTG